MALRGSVVPWHAAPLTAPGVKHPKASVISEKNFPKIPIQIVEN